MKIYGLSRPFIIIYKKFKIFFHTYVYKFLICTAKKTVISPDFLVWKFYGKAQFLHSFRRFARNDAETVPFHKIPTPEH